MLQALTRGNLGRRRLPVSDDPLVSGLFNAGSDLGAPPDTSALGLVVPPALVTPTVPNPPGVPAAALGSVPSVLTGGAPKPAGLVLPEAYAVTEPKPRDTRAARLAQVVASLGGAAATLAAGPEGGGVFGGMSAVLAGGADGAGRYAGRIEAEDAEKMAAWETGLRQVIQSRDTADRAAADAASRDLLQSERADDRQDQADAAAAARQQAQLDAQEARDVRQAVQAQAAAALDARDVDGYVALATEFFDMDEGTARGIAEGYVERAARADLIQDRDYQVRVRGVLATEASGRLARERFVYERNRPRPAPRTPAAPRAGRTPAAPPSRTPAGRPAPSSASDPAFQDGGRYDADLDAVAAQIQGAPQDRQAPALQAYLGSLADDVRSGRLRQSTADALEAALLDRLGF